MFITFHYKDVLFYFSVNLQQEVVQHEVFLLAPTEQGFFFIAYITICDLRNINTIYNIRPTKPEISCKYADIKCYFTVKGWGVVSNNIAYIPAGLVYTHKMIWNKYNNCNVDVLWMRIKEALT